MNDIDLDVDPELRDKVAAALDSMGVGGLSDEDKEDEDDDSATKYEEAYLNDDQMMELDEQLAEIFRTRKAAAHNSKSKLYL